MAKRKQKSAWVKTQGFGTKRLADELRRAEAKMARGDWAGASQVLQPLSQQYPQEERVWQYLAEVSYEIGNPLLYQHACEGLFATKPTGDTAYALGSAYLRNQHSLMALQTFRQALELDPDHEVAPKARNTVQQLEPSLEAVLADMGLTEADGLEIALLHERSQAYLEQGDYAAAQAVATQVLERHPNFVSACNNLSLAQWMMGDIEGAIATAQSVLAQEADNIHALSNLIHFQVISDHEAAARTYQEPIKVSQGKAWDGWTKKVEGLSYLADDDGVLEVWQQTQTDGEAVLTSPLFHHLVAVALARTGNTRQAIAQWKKALEQDPSFKLAQENLADISKPTGFQHGAWPFSWEQWLLPTTGVALQETLQAAQGASAAKVLASVHAFLQSHPDLTAMLPRILERGGPAGQEFVLRTAEQFKTPELLNAIKDFALSQNGTDPMRNQAAVLAAQAKLIPKEKVTLWIGGQWREIMLMAYTFHGEPLTRHSKPVERLLQRAILLLKQGGKERAAEAEALLQQALEQEPDAPDLLNNLASSLMQQGQVEASLARLHDIVERYPDYIFSPTALAHEHLLRGDIETAETLLKPFLLRESFHFLEFGVFADAYLELLWAKKQKDGVRGWLNIWEQVSQQSGIDDPRLESWKQRLKRGLTPKRLK